MEDPFFECIMTPCICMMLKMERKIEMLRKLRPGPESFVPGDREESKADGVDHEEEEKTGEDTEEKENMIRKTLPSIGNR